MTYLIVFLLTALGALAIVGLSSLFLYGYYKGRRLSWPAFTPDVCVIVPCKENELNLPDNLQAICTQDYPHYRVLFVVDSENDAAYPVVSQVSQAIKHSQIVFTKKIKGCSGKIAALITGVQNAKDALVYVFADSDICPQPQWLSSLVAPLSDQTIAATTGFRWYFPTSWRSSLVSTWNMAAISGLFHPISIYTWGGSTAIRADLFEKLSVASHWQGGFSDDLILTKIVKKAGYCILFIPKCISESPSDVTMKRFLQWGSQQFTWMKWYDPFLWVPSFVGVLLINLFSLLGFVFMATGQLILGLFMVSLLFFEMIYGLIGILTLRRLMGYPKEKFRFIYRYPLLMPLVFFLYGYNSLISCVKKQIVWAGRTYRKKDIVR